MTTHPTASDQSREAFEATIRNTIGFNFKDGELQTVNADDLLRLAAAILGVQPEPSEAMLEVCFEYGNQFAASRKWAVTREWIKGFDTAIDYVDSIRTKVAIQSIGKGLEAIASEFGLEGASSDPLLTAMVDEGIVSSSAPSETAETCEWEKLRDPALLHAALLRGLPARLTREQLLHLAGSEAPTEGVKAEPGNRKGPFYPETDPVMLGEYYIRHVGAMTAEDLHSKADIAAQLAWRDREIDRLEALAMESALAASPEPAQPSDRDEFAWLVVQEACETEPADVDDPETIAILRLDLKAAVLAAMLRADLAQPCDPEPVDMLKVCEALGFDPTNHHNAAKCPYCSPAQPCAPAAPKLIGWRTDDYLNETADKKQADNWSVHHTMLPIFEGDPHTKLASVKALPSPEPAEPDKERDAVTVAFRLAKNELPKLRHFESSYGGTWTSDWCAAISMTGDVSIQRLSASDGEKKAFERSEISLRPWREKNVDTVRGFVAWAYLEDIRAAMAGEAEGGQS